MTGVAGKWFKLVKNSHCNEWQHLSPTPNLVENYSRLQAWAFEELRRGSLTGLWADSTGCVELGPTSTTVFRVAPQDRHAGLLSPASDTALPLQETSTYCTGPAWGFIRYFFKVLWTQESWASVPLSTHALSERHNTYPRGMTVSLFICCLQSTQTS